MRRPLHISSQPNTASPAPLPIKSECLMDMWCTCKYVQRMGVMVQIRNVPSEFHRELKARAALEGMSLSDYWSPRSYAVTLARRQSALSEALKLSPISRFSTHRLFACGFARPHLADATPTDGARGRLPGTGGGVGRHTRYTGPRLGKSSWPSAGEGSMRRIAADGRDRSLVTCP